MTEKKDLEENLAAKMRIIERMLNSERELQETIHELRLELDSRPDPEELEAQRRQDEHAVERVQKELKEVAAEKDRLASENGSMKRQMLRKEFESKLFMEDSAGQIQDRQERQVRQDRQERQDLDRKYS